MSFLRKRNFASLQELELSKSAPSAQTAPPAPVESSVGATKPEQRKLTYAEQRERDKMLRRAAKKVAEAEGLFPRPRVLWPT